ncbi:MAG: RNA polymerase sigma factor [Gemmatimonadota bacterium]|nr:MAG: RNA polymerase sigma factor [Gemmatimonadota bacterium]
MEESRLIERVLDGDPASERRLYEVHVDRVYRLAYRMTGEEDLAEECTQETFIRAFERLDQFRGAAAFSTWLHSIAISVIYNVMRKVTRLRSRHIDLDEAVGAVSSAADPDLKERVAAAIDALPLGYRTVFVMHDVEGYKHEEIAAALGVQAGTSKAQLSRARAKLREALADFAEEWAS